MDFDKTGTVVFVSKVIEKLKGKWLNLICSSLILSFLIFAISEVIDLTPFVALPVIGFVLLGEITFVRNLITGNSYKLEDIFAHYKLFVTAFLTTALMFVLISVGFALLIVPGIILLVNYSFALHILEEKQNIGALEALKQSKELSSGHRFRIGMFYLLFFVLSVLVFGVSLAIILIPNLIWGINLLLYAGLLAGVIEILFIIPLFYASVTMFYDALKSGVFAKEEKPKKQKQKEVVVEEVEVIKEEKTEE